MSSATEPEKDQAGAEKKDALDEWVDELDRLIGIEPMNEEEIAEQQRVEKQKKGVDPVGIILVVIIALAVIALLFYFRVI